MTLIGYWPLNETEGDRAYDYSGNENHGSLEGSPTQGENGVIGSNAYEFDGESDFVNVGRSDQSELNGKSQASFCAWIKTEASSRRRIYNLAKSSVLDVNFATSTSPVLWIVDDEGNELRLNDGPSINDGRWHHYTAVWLGRNSYRIYIDGKEVTDQMTEHTAESPSTIHSGDDERETIGADYPDEAGYWDGIISELRVYNRALSPSEVQYLYSVSQRGRFYSDMK